MCRQTASSTENRVASRSFSKTTAPWSGFEHSTGVPPPDKFSFLPLRLCVCLRLSPFRSDSAVQFFRLPPGVIFRSIEIGDDAGIINGNTKSQILMRADKGAKIRGV